MVTASSPISGARKFRWMRASPCVFRRIAVGGMTGKTIHLAGPTRVRAVSLSPNTAASVCVAAPILVEDQTYTLLISGASVIMGTHRARDDHSLPWRVNQAPSLDAEAWRPGTGGWLAERTRTSPWRRSRPYGRRTASAVSGRVLQLDGRPLPDVTLEIPKGIKRRLIAQADSCCADGLATAEHALKSTPARRTHRAGRMALRARIVVRAGGTNVLPFTIWSPLIVPLTRLRFPRRRCARVSSRR